MNFTSEPSHSLTRERRATEIALSLGWVVVLFSWLITSYFDVHLTDSLSFRVNDGNCDRETGQGLGQHCFGDFGQPYNRAKLNREFESGVLNAATPVQMMTMRVLSHFPYNVSLGIYFLVFLLPTVAMLLTCRRWLEGRKTAEITLIMLGSVGFIGGVDRANTALILGPLMFALLAQYGQKHYVRYAALVVLGSLFKWWFPLLMVPLLARQKYRLSFATLSALFASHILVLAALPGPSVVAKWEILSGTIFDAKYASSVSRTAISIQTLLGRSSCILVSCKESPREGLGAYFVLVSVGVIFLYCLLIFVYFRTHDLDTCGTFLISCVPFAIIPESQIYSLYSLTGGILFWCCRGGSALNPSSESSSEVERPPGIWSVGRVCGPFAIIACLPLSTLWLTEAFSDQSLFASLGPPRATYLLAPTFAVWVMYSAFRLMFATKA